mmetsp:Transcript_12279/g.51709  ORF Transcript_12279/g.51709 Transcript_12279/m.51709 type:complete len:236 (-) Transcript_12279:4151-4858(-)
MAATSSGSPSWSPISVKLTMSQKKMVACSYLSAPTFSPRVSRAATSGGSMRSSSMERRVLAAGSKRSALRSGVRLVPPELCILSSAASISSSEGRRSGLCSRQSSISWTTPVGADLRISALMVGRSLVSSERTSSRMSRVLLPLWSAYGTSRAKHSQHSMPRPYTSDASLLDSPASSSGAIQNGVPTAERRPAPSMRPFVDERPKSDSLQSKLSFTSTLAALISPCMMGSLPLCR